MTSKVPSMFFYNENLHRKEQIVRSASSVVAWCYKDQELVWIPTTHVIKYHKKAYTVDQAANIIGISSGRIYNLIKAGLVNEPERAYDYDRGTYAPQSRYFSEDELIALRQAAWDVLPKNRFGIPHDDTMISEDTLRHKIQSGDTRDFIVNDDGETVRIYRA